MCPIMVDAGRSVAVVGAEDLLGLTSLVRGCLEYLDGFLVAKQFLECLQLITCISATARSIHGFTRCRYASMLEYSFELLRYSWF